MTSALPSIPSPHPSVVDELHVASTLPTSAVESVLVKRLSPQQTRVAVLVAKGYSTATIATKMGIAESTVANHRQAALRQIGGHSAIALVHWAIANHLLEPLDMPGELERED